VKESVQQVDPGKDKFRDVAGTQIALNQEAVGANIRERYVVSASEIQSQNKKEKTSVKYASWIIKVCGIHFFKMNSVFKCKNFSHIDGENFQYQLTNMQYSDEGKGLYTTITLKADAVKPVKIFQKRSENFR
jgi:hypothetical protein